MEGIPFLERLLLGGPHSLIWLRVWAKFQANLSILLGQNTVDNPMLFWCLWFLLVFFFFIICVCACNYLKEAIHSWASIFKKYKVLCNKNTCFSCYAVTDSHPQGNRPCFLFLFLEICIHWQAKVFTLTVICCHKWTLLDTLICICFFHLYMHLGHWPISTVLEKAIHTYHVLKHIYIIYGCT